jgi:hypothetical protein
MRMRGPALSFFALMFLPLFLTLFLIEGCVTSQSERVLRSGWKADWNARIDASTGRMDHPCGDFVFDAWAAVFQGDCERDLSPVCDQKIEWLIERSRQCDEWQQYLLRNHFRHVRRDNIPEPDMHMD